VPNFVQIGLAIAREKNKRKKTNQQNNIILVPFLQKTNNYRKKIQPCSTISHMGQCWLAAGHTMRCWIVPAVQRNASDAM